MRNRNALLLGGAAALTAAAIGGSAVGSSSPSSKPAPAYLDQMPSFIDGINPVCAVKLGGTYTNKAAVDTDLHKANHHFRHDSVVVSASAGHIGQVLNFAVLNPNTDQHPGDVVVANTRDQAACKAVGGEFTPDPTIVPGPGALPGLG